jgi:MFS family permease
LAPLAATLAVQTLATGAAYSIPAMAPEIARHVGINPALVGIYISLVYGVGILSALLSPGYIYSRGATRVSQAVLIATVAMLLTAAFGSAAMIVLSAALMGLAYGATAPSSTHLLVPRTPKPHMNVVLSLRQIGVPLGGMLAGLLMPPLALAVGWRTALLLQLVPTLLLLAALEAARHRWDAPLPGQTPASVGIRAMVRLLKGDRPLQRLSFASFVYAGLQICFIAFMTTQLTTVVGMPLIQAGQILALYQLAGVVSRPVWGWLADHVMPARLLLALQGAIMCLAAVLTGRFAPDWPVAMIALVSIAGGATASGYTGIAYAEYARLGGPRRTEATGLGSAFMFAGVMVLPAAMSGVVTLAGSYAQVYSVIGALALVAGLGLVWGIREAPRRS